MNSNKKLVVHESEGKAEPDICGTAIELINRQTSFPQNVSIATIIIEPRKSSERHYHKNTEEIYYIMEGNAEMEIDGEIFSLQPGHAVLIPIGKSHQIKNTGGTELKFLSVDAPIFDPDDVITD